MSEIEMTPPTSIDDSSKDIFKGPVYRQTSLNDYVKYSNRVDYVRLLYKYVDKLKSNMPSCLDCTLRRYGRCKHYNWKEDFDKQNTRVSIELRIARLKCLRKNAYLYFKNLSNCFEIDPNTPYYREMVRYFWSSTSDELRRLEHDRSLNKTM